MTWEQAIPLLTGLIGAVGGLALAVLAYRRSVKVDAVSAQSGAVDNARAGTAQIIEGLNSLNDNLQEDNKIFRDQLKYLETRFDAVVKERDDLRRELLRMRRKYGENGESVDP